MSQVTKGDRVRIAASADQSIHTPHVGHMGTVVTTDPDGAYIRLDSYSGSRVFYYSNEIRRPDGSVPQSEYVHVIESRQIWVTLPGDTAGHKLTEEEANALFRQLEAVL